MERTKLAKPAQAARFVSYLRVSTQKQARSGKGKASADAPDYRGLGIEAQREAVDAYLRSVGGKLVASFTEVESGRRDDNRPQLAAALSACKLHHAVLVIAKMDRLSRDAHFLIGLQKAGVRFVATDMPEANELVVGIMAVVAQAERRMISERTKAALAIVKAQGIKLGGRREGGHEWQPEDHQKSSAIRGAKANARAAELKPWIERAHGDGIISFNKLARYLNDHDVPAARGGQWYPMQVRDVVQRLDAM